jgi:hypothetical protein
VAQAQKEFAARNWDKAIQLYRKHLRSNRGDVNTWNQLAAAYYHTGLPRRALRYLKHVERRTTERSYNFYYQGLCFSMLGQMDDARIWFRAASVAQDEYGARSTFELGTIEYNDRVVDRASYWLNLYLQRFPTGVYRAQAVRMLQSIQNGTYIEGITGVEKPDMEKALYRYNKLSLFDFPHYWLVQGGYSWAGEEGWEPNYNGELRSRFDEKHGVTGTAAFGAGPWRSGPMTAWGGYNYRQLWVTDQNRFSTWLEDPLDLEYFPLRGDLLERRHQFYGDFRRAINDRWFVGVFGRIEFARVGSSFFPSPEDSDLRTVINMSDTTLLIPWVGVTWWRDFRTLAYLYMRKEINSNSAELSNKSYDLGLTGGEPAFSLGISQNMPFPEVKLDANVELFRYEFIYNDYWLDYTREGAIASVEYEILPRWYLTGLMGIYEDRYQIGRLKFGSCSNKPSSTGAADSQPIQCQRTDSGLMYQVGGYWNWTQFTRISGNYLVVTNSNPKQKEFAGSKQSFNVVFTMAFPSVKRVDRFVNRFADSAFTKEAE